MKRCLPTTALFFSAALTAMLVQRVRAGEPVVPGTGEFLKDCCDDFEDADWKYYYNFPKSSHEQDENQRPPGGFSNNKLWHEGGKRGTPDVVKRIATPPGGLAGSKGALLIATEHSGIPGTYSNQQQQDDLLMMFNRRLGRSIPMSWQPSCTVRVYLPPWEDWEKRNGPSFGMRCDCMGREPDGSMEAYWPGMFILRNEHKDKDGKIVQAAKITIRGDGYGRDVRSLDIDEPGWWTFGISFSDDGQIHYYAHKGVAELTEKDHLMSSFPYGERCTSFNNFFFNVANWDNGHTWSTPWVIDDPKVYVIPPFGQQVAQLYRVRRQPQQQMTRGRSRQQGSNNSASRSNYYSNGQMQR
ncbi:MAG TPA: hypothetical protein VHE81_05055 [Lacipirellulaceae bacterium]|nr:hypothetical protein [Lacipirellulaceae bacterium]